MTEIMKTAALVACLALAMLWGVLIITAPLWLPACLLVWWLT